MRDNVIVGGILIVLGLTIFLLFAYSINAHDKKRDDCLSHGGKWIEDGGIMMLQNVGNVMVPTYIPTYRCRYEE